MLNYPKRLNHVMVFFSMLFFFSCQQEKSEVLMVEYRTLQDLEGIYTINDSIVPPILYNNVFSLKELDLVERKKRFIDLMLPSILVAKYQIERDREKLEDIRQTIENLGVLTHIDSTHLNQMMTTYRAEKIDELLVKLEVHPVSIVLAQAALESGWGTSRFFTEANNIFGIWSFSTEDDRIRAMHARDGKSVYVKSYDDLSASITDYFKTLSRNNAYKTFREKRQETDNSLELIPYLHRYSEQGYEYVRKLELVIRKNDLVKYDSYRLDPDYIEETDLTEETIVAMAD